jgi:hypothetical protein
VTWLRRALGLDDAPPPPRNHENGVKSPAEAHYEGAVTEAREAMERSKRAHDHALDVVRQMPSWEDLIHPEEAD